MSSKRMMHGQTGIRGRAHEGMHRRRGLLGVHQQGQQHSTRLSDCEAEEIVDGRAWER